MSSSPVNAPAGAQWFALHTLSGQEGKVKAYIEKFKTVVVIAASLLLGLFTSISDFALYQVIDLCTQLVK